MFRILKSLQSAWGGPDYLLSPIHQPTSNPGVAHDRRSPAPNRLLRKGAYFRKMTTLPAEPSSGDGARGGRLPAEGTSTAAEASRENGMQPCTPAAFPVRRTGISERWYD
jgi:hypothetical protein